jgi:hypothetical protein
MTDAAETTMAGLQKARRLKSGKSLGRHEMDSSAE